MRHLHRSFEIKDNKTALEWEEEDPNAVARSHHRHHIVRHSRRNTRKARYIKEKAHQLSPYTRVYMHGYQIIRKSENKTESTTEHATSRTSSP